MNTEVKRTFLTQRNSPVWLWHGEVITKLQKGGKLGHLWRALNARLKLIILGRVMMSLNVFKQERNKFMILFKNFYLGNHGFFS